MFFKKEKDEEIIDVEASDVKTEEELRMEKEKREEELLKKEEEKEEKRVERRHSFINAAFILKMLLAAFLLAIGIWFLVDRETAKMIVILTSGVLVGLLCLGRIIWFFKDKKSSKNFKICTAVEIGLELIVGFFLIFSGIKYETSSDNESKFITFVEDNYRYFIGAVIYLRGVMHFFSVSFFKTKVSVANFVVNIGFITLGTFCIFSTKATVSNIAWVMIVLIFIGFAYLAGDGVYQYIKWKQGPNNNGEKTKRKDKKKDKEKEDRASIPNLGIDEPKDETDQSIIS